MKISRSYGPRDSGQTLLRIVKLVGELVNRKCQCSVLVDENFPATLDFVIFHILIDGTLHRPLADLTTRKGNTAAENQQVELETVNNMFKELQSSFASAVRQNTVCTDNGHIFRITDTATYFPITTPW